MGFAHVVTASGLLTARVVLGDNLSGGFSRPQKPQANIPRE